MKNILFIPSNLESRAIVYYRCIQPARYLNTHKSANCKILTKFQNDKGYIDLSPFKWADIIVMQRFYDKNNFLRPLQEGYKRFEGKKIYELDDLVWKIPYRKIRREYNKTKKFTKQLIKEADVITCTTDYLKEQVLKKRPDARVDVVPNSVDSAMWLHRRPDYDKIRILYAGGGTHWNEVKFIKKVLKRIRQKYDVETILLSPYLKEREGDIWHRVYGFVPFKNFPKYMRGLAPDIMLAPVIKKRAFDMSKSEIKFLDATMAGAASVLEDCPVYDKVESAIKVNGVNNWVEAIEELLDNKKREKLIKKAKDEVWARFDIHTNFRLWREAFRQ